MTEAVQREKYSQIEVSANSRRAKKILAEMDQECSNNWAFLVGWTLHPKGDRLRIIGDLNFIKSHIFNPMSRKFTKRQLGSVSWGFYQ